MTNDAVPAPVTRTATRDVFLSYSNRDKAVADATCHALESAGVRVWIAPRDLVPSADWAASIVDAIATSRAMVVIFSAHANRSGQVVREVERAVHHGLTIIPFRVEDVVPSGSMEYFLSTPHWLDALTAPLEAHLERLVRTVRLLLDGTERGVFEGAASVGGPGRGREPMRSTAPLGPEDQRLLPVLRDRVRQFWIEGVLERSVSQTARLTLGKEVHAEAVEHPWGRVLELPGGRSSAIPPEKPVEVIFEESGRSLLILGEPGSGKTTTLLELADDLLGRSERDAARPVPVVFNLSSWTPARRALFGWLVDELGSKYYIGRKTARRWFDEARIVPLLDGLDEVRPSLRPACVHAIDRFAEEHGPPGLAVACRRADYVAMAVRLRLNSAVVLQPLRPDQVDAALERAGARLGALRTALREDETLRELARSPLMLSVLSLAYEHAPANVLVTGRRPDAEALRRHVFSTYVERMFQRRGREEAWYPKARAIEWLGWLARQMDARSQTILQLEHLQPNWLPRWTERLVYVAVTRFSLVLLLLLVYFCDQAVSSIATPATAPPPIWGNPWRLVLSVLFVGGAATAIDLGLLSGTFGQGRRTALHALLLLFTYSGLTWLLTRTALFAVQGDATGVSAASGYVMVGLALWFFLGFQGVGRSLIDDVHPRERLTYSWRGAGRGVLLGSTAALLELVVRSSASPRGDASLGAPPMTDLVTQWLAYLLVWALPGAVIGSLVGGSSTGKTAVNQGVILTARNALVMATVAMVAVAIACAGALGLTVVEQSVKSAALFIAWTALSFGLLVFLYLATPVLRHGWLRLILRLRGHTPPDLPAFLEYAVRLGLMRRVGGGYMFMHRLVHDHFARRHGAQGEA